MIVRYKEDRENFEARWQEYILENIHSPRYLSSYLDYMKFYSKDILSDESFVVVESNKCVGICFLPVEQANGVVSISLSGYFTVAPLAISDRVYDIVFKEIFEIGKNYNVGKIMFYLDSLVMEFFNKYNYLIKYVFIDSTGSNCVLDLCGEKSTLWSRLRKCYKPLINGIFKNSEYDFVVVSKENPSYEIHEAYRELHKKAAGRETRPKTTFDKQYEMLQNGNATIIGLRYKGQFIGLCYFLHTSEVVVYMSAADDPEFTSMKIPIYHAILQKATEYFHDMGFKHMEYSQPAGYNLVDGFLDYLDEKQINIAHFKRGMGTKMVPLFRGVKYFDKNLLLKDIDSFREKCVSSFESMA